MQIGRPEGYEDCIATRGIEKGGPSGTLRDALAIMYSGMYVTYGVVQRCSHFSFRWRSYGQSPHHWWFDDVSTPLKDKYYHHDLPHLHHVPSWSPAEDSRRVGPCCRIWPTTHTWGFWIASVPPSCMERSITLASHCSDQYVFLLYSDVIFSKPLQTSHMWLRKTKQIKDTGCQRVLSFSLTQGDILSD